MPRCLLLIICLISISTAYADEDDNDVLTDKSATLLEIVEVHSQRKIINQSIESSVNSISKEKIELIAAKHPNEILNQIPGSWISRGSGQEHLTAIRSPVLTGSGACGAYMVLEDQVPTRPSGFCNVNQLFEVNLAQAQSIEVLRGPGTVSYGSNALHGAISIETPGPAPQSFSEYGLEIGTDNYYRGEIALSSQQIALQAQFTDSDSFRDDEHYQHGLINLQFDHATTHTTGRTSFAYANLDQDTAGYIPGKDSYKDEDIRTQNFNPEAFRKAWAARMSSRWNWMTSAGNSFEVIPYARSSQMDFLQHFLPGIPLEENGQNSIGALMSWSNNESWAAGIDLEWAKGDLTEFQEHPTESDSAFLRATRPQGYHYDYDVRASTTAAWIQWQHEISTRLDLTAGLRAEYIAYKYDNHMLDGNTKDDGTACGFGGCLYTRPADRDDSFSNVSPEFGLNYQLNEQQSIYFRAARGYRAPQATELYRLQKGQTVADLNPVKLDSLEVGFKTHSEAISFEFSAFAMKKKNFIFRDSNGYNISDGKTSHIGLETLLQWQTTETINLSANLSWAQHQYEFNRDAALGETISKGNEIDTAPPWLGAFRMHWQSTSKTAVEAEWVYQGSYFLNAANTARYSGHSLLNLRGWVRLANDRHRLSLRLTNLLDDRYAERADFAFGNYRYFPGAGRRISVEWQYRH